MASPHTSPTVSSPPLPPCCRGVTFFVSRPTNPFSEGAGSRSSTKSGESGAGYAKRVPWRCGMSFCAVASSVDGGRRIGSTRRRDPVSAREGVLRFGYLLFVVRRTRGSVKKTACARFWGWCVSCTLVFNKGAAFVRAASSGRRAWHVAVLFVYMCSPNLLRCCAHTHRHPRSSFHLGRVVIFFAMRCPKSLPGTLFYGFIITPAYIRDVEKKG